jgi:hypothetical protein
VSNVLGQFKGKFEFRIFGQPSVFQNKPICVQQHVFISTEQLAMFVGRNGNMEVTKLFVNMAMMRQVMRSNQAVHIQ